MIKNLAFDKGLGVWFGTFHTLPLAGEIARFSAEVGDMCCLTTTPSAQGRSKLR